MTWAGEFTEQGQALEWAALAGGQTTLRFEERVGTDFWGPRLPGCRISGGTRQFLQILQQGRREDQRAEARPAKGQTRASPSVRGVLVPSEADWAGPTGWGSGDAHASREEGVTGKPRWALGQPGGGGPRARTREDEARARPRGSALSPAARSAWRGRTQTVRAAAPASLRTPNPQTRHRTNRSRSPSRAHGGESERRRCLERRPLRVSAEGAGPPRPRARHPGTCSLWRGQIETWPAADCESLGDIYLSYRLTRPEKSSIYAFQQLDRAILICMRQKALAPG